MMTRLKAEWREMRDVEWEIELMWRRSSGRLTRRSWRARDEVSHVDWKQEVGAGHVERRVTGGGRFVTASGG